MVDMRRTASQNDRRQQLRQTILASLAGGSGGYYTVTSAPVINYFLRKDPRYAIASVASLAPYLHSGSGEGIMARNYMDLAGKAGQNSYFVNPSVWWDGVWWNGATNRWELPTRSLNPSELTYLNSKAFINGSGSAERLIAGAPESAWRRALRVSRSYLAGLKGLNEYSIGPHTRGMSPAEIQLLADKGFVPRGKVIAGIPDAIWDEFLTNASSFTGASKEDILRRISRGQFDGFRLGELVDNLKLPGMGADALTGKVKMMPYSKFKENIASGKGPMSVFTGERNMNYSSLMPGGENAVRYDEVLKDLGNARNMARDVGFVANYAPDTQKLIPGSKIDTSWWNRSSILSRIRHRIDRKFLQRFINDARGVPVDLSGKKIIVLSGGSFTPMAVEKIEEVAKALEGRDNIHVLVQGGKGFTSGTSSVNPGTVELMRRLPSDKFTFIDTSPHLRRLNAGSDLNFAYGGSSSLTEAIGNRTPSIFLRDSGLNEGNVDFAVNRFGMKAVDTSSLGINSRIDKYMTLHPGSTLEDAIREVGKTPTAQNLIRSEAKRPGLSLMDHALSMRGAGVSEERARLKSFISDVLDRPDYRNSVENVSRVKNAIRSIISRNREVSNVSGGVQRVLAGAKAFPWKYRLPAILAGGVAAGGIANKLYGYQRSNDTGVGRNLISSRRS